MKDLFGVMEVLMVVALLVLMWLSSDIHIIVKGLITYLCLVVHGLGTYVRAIRKALRRQL